tara:strand:+ start:335 stop:1153 length:819 start_codon:yes stop_codon:yes gene_type:complete
MNQEEKTLRSNIRDLIRFVKKKKTNEKNLFEQNIITIAELELKKMLEEAATPDVDPTPNKSTGINVLEELLKKIVPVLETDYKSLTTNESQRQSFRSHIVNAVVKTLTPAIANNKADGTSDELTEVEIDLVDDTDDPIGGDKFIDIRTDAEKKAEEEENAPDEREEFGDGVEGDETGRNMAYQSFKKIETAIIDSYELLSDPEDQELFYDYLIANLKLYFNKFEDELSGSVEEPSNQAYDDAVAAGDAAADGGEPGEGAPEDDEEFDLDINL